MRTYMFLLDDKRRLLKYYNITNFLSNEKELTAFKSTLKNESNKASYYFNRAGYISNKLAIFDNSTIEFFSLDDQIMYYFLFVEIMMPMICRR